MRRVSFNVSKVLKKVGYPQDITCDYLFDKNGNPCNEYTEDEIYTRPTYLEVWLWLWREKKESIDILSAHNHDALVYINNELKGFKDPEEAIAMAIEHLVDNDLIK